MDFLLIHWHCALPVAGLIVAAMLTRGRPDRKNNKENRQ
jgi:hypothetical protein